MCVLLRVVQHLPEVLVCSFVFDLLLARTCAVSVVEASVCSEDKRIMFGQTQCFVCFTVSVPLNGTTGFVGCFQMPRDAMDGILSAVFRNVPFDSRCSIGLPCSSCTDP